VYNSSCGTAGANCPPDRGPDHDFGASAMLVRAPDGREVLVAGQKSGMVYALDPANRGAVLWQARVGTGGINGGIQWGMASDGHLVFAAVSDVVRPSTVSGPSPGVPCRPPRAGCSPAQPAAVSAIAGAVFSGSMDGHIRAFSAADGSLLWDFDTARIYTTVNGVPASGGSLDGAGPVIGGGMVFVNSGYPRFGGTPGNVLLAFGLR
jgi:polyvinyl alcohol dehydrogenase (cytochrome)